LGAAASQARQGSSAREKTPPPTKRAKNGSEVTPPKQVRMEEDPAGTPSSRLIVAANEGHRKSNSRSSLEDSRPEEPWRGPSRGTSTDEPFGEERALLSQFVSCACEGHTDNDSLMACVTDDMGPNSTAIEIQRQAIRDWPNLPTPLPALARQACVRVKQGTADWPIHFEGLTVERLPYEDCQELRTRRCRVPNTPLQQNR
jgi:hypothetical protein